MIKKLSRIQAELKAPKSQRNNFGNYNYRSCEDILEAVKPLLKEEGLVLTITDEIELVGGRYYVKATATVTDGEKSISTTAYAREAEDRKGMDPSQVTGSSSSYARKYALNGLFCIDDTKDADTMKPEEEAPKAKPKTKAKAEPKPEPKIPTKQESAAKLTAEMERLHISKDDLKSISNLHFEGKSWTKMTDAEAAQLANNIGDYAVQLFEEDGKLMEGIA